MQKIVNRDVNVSGMQTEYRADRGRVLRLHVTDLDLFADFRLGSGRVEIVNADHPNAVVRIDLDGLLNLIEGRIKVSQQDGSIRMDEYTPFDAWRRGELMIEASESECWLSDLTLLSGDIYAKAFPVLRRQLGG